jgi:hypothetical protein
MSSYNKTNALVFKGDKKKKKRERENREDYDNDDNNNEREEIVKQQKVADDDKEDDEVVEIKNGTGRITSSSTTISGHYTKFMDELGINDAILITHPITLQQETKIVRMVLSNTSIGISSAFSSDLVSTTSFRYIKAPKEYHNKEKEKALNNPKGEKRKDEEALAYGTYGSKGGQELVYRVRKDGAFGGYKIVKENASNASREHLLEQRSKKKSDRFCY